MWALVAAAYAGCEPKMVDRAVETVKGASAEVRVELGAAAFGAACGETAFGAHVATLANVPPDMRGLLEMKGAADSPALWMGLCGGTEGLRVLADLTKLAPSDRRAHLWAKCGLEKAGWMTEAEWLGASGLLVTPFMAGAQLAADGVDAKKARPMVRALAGLGPE